MVATTGTQGIRYPQLTDAPCDYAQHMQWLAEDIDVRLTSHDADLDRTLLPPTMVLSLDTPTPIALLFGLLDYVNVINPTRVVPFEAVRSQSGGVWARPGVNSFLFAFPRTGYYQVGLNFIVNLDEEEGLPNATVAQVDQSYLFQLWKYPEISQRIGISQRDYRNYGESGTTSGMLRVTSTSDRYYWRIEVVGIDGTFNTTITVNAARMMAAWVGDL